MAAPNETEIQAQIEELASPSCSAKFLLDYYGFDRTNAALVDHVERWANVSRVKRKFVDGDRFRRTTLELYFQSNQCLPRKWAAAALGMTLSDFDRTLAALHKRGPFLQVGEVVDAVVSERVISSFADNFSGDHPYLFDDHQRFCQWIHGAIKSEFGFVVAPLLCNVTERLEDETEREFADEFDCISLEPMCGRHHVWLNFEKPMRLPRDKCSTVTFAKYRKWLEPFAFGSNPSITNETERAAGE